jgi:hypothetical protein
MNDEQLHHLESQLRQLRPASLSDALNARLQSEPTEEPLTISDRILATLTAIGSLAATLILALILYQLSLPKPPVSTPADLAARKQLAAEYQSLELAARWSIEWE